MSSTVTHNAQTESDPYRYKDLLPYFAQDSYPPLIPFEHIDPGFRALSHPDPRAFLSNAAKVTDLTPNLGTEVQGVQLTELDATGRDQLALQVIKAHPFIVVLIRSGLGCSEGTCCLPGPT